MLTNLLLIFFLIRSNKKDKESSGNLPTDDSDSSSKLIEGSEKKSEGLPGPPTFEVQDKQVNASLSDQSDDDDDSFDAANPKELVQNCKGKKTDVLESKDKNVSVEDGDGAMR